MSLSDEEIDKIIAPWLAPDGEANRSDARAIVRAADRAATINTFKRCATFLESQLMSNETRWCAKQIRAEIARLEAEK